MFKTSLLLFEMCSRMLTLFCIFLVLHIFGCDYVMLMKTECFIFNMKVVAITWDW